jgi:hypothetical protein
VYEAIGVVRRENRPVSQPELVEPQETRTVTQLELVKWDGDNDGLLITHAKDNFVKHIASRWSRNLFIRLLVSRCVYSRNIVLRMSGFQSKR